MSEFTESLSQAFGTEEVAEETKTEETEVITTEETEEVTDEATEDTETEEAEEGTEEEAEKFTLKNRIDGDKEVTMDELVEFAEKGTDYDRVKSKQAEHDKLVNQLYPQFKNVTELIKAMRDNDLETAKQEYRDKGLEDADIDKILASDERFKELESQVEELDGARNTEKVETDLKAETKALNKEFGTDYKSFDSVDKAVKEKASQHDITLSEAYYLVNKDTIISSKVKKTKQSMNADIKDKRAKAVPKNGGSKSETAEQTDLEKKMSRAFGLK